MKYIILNLSLAFAITTINTSVQARPISYNDSWTVMQKNNAKKNKLHIHYSPSFKNSIGATLNRVKAIEQEPDKYLLGLQWNHLLYRKNTDISQANVYSKVEIAQYIHQDTATDIALTIAGDWETRRWFTSYALQLDTTSANTKANTIGFVHEARVGVAPYVAKYNSLHTWLMLNIEHTPQSNNKLTFTPLVRLFKGEYLFEVGVSNEGSALINWIKRF